MILFRTGVRRGNPDVAEVGKHTLSMLFYVRNHPNYQRTMALDRYWKAVMPEEVKRVVEESMSTSRRGNTGHYQGGDACLEEINKNAKSWISPHGVPSDEEWLKVFRSLDKLNEVSSFIIPSF